MGGCGLSGGGEVWRGGIPPKAELGTGEFDRRSEPMGPKAGRLTHVFTQTARSATQEPIATGTGKSGTALPNRRLSCASHPVSVDGPHT